MRSTEQSCGGGVWAAQVVAVVQNHALHRAELRWGRLGGASRRRGAEPCAPPSRAAVGAFGRRKSSPWCRTMRSTEQSCGGGVWTAQGVAVVQNHALHRADYFLPD